MKFWFITVNPKYATFSNNLFAIFMWRSRVNYI
jgi:hypothetical protein